MSADIAAQAVSLKTAQTQQIAQLSILKKQHEMQQQLIEMVDAVIQSAPVPEGQGTRVDKTA